MKNVVTLINKGGGKVAEDARQAVREALAAAGIDSEILLVAGHACADRAAEAVQRGATTIIAAGGDGTIGGVAGALAGTKAALGILPMGTLNHFARDLGIPFDLAEAAKVIAAGRMRAIDIADVNGRAFVNNAAIGLYPLMLVDRDSQRKRLGRSKRLAVLVASLRTMMNFHHQRLRFSMGGGAAWLDTPLLFVGNNDYRLSLPSAGRRETLDGGELSIFVMRSKSLPGFLAATARALVGRSRDNDMVRLDEVAELKVDSDCRILTLAIDGETEKLQTPLTFRIRPKALKVIAPAGPGRSKGGK